MSIPITTLAAMITMSIRILRIKTGMVILVGSAARLVTSDIPMATRARTKRKRLVPASSTAMMVMGVRMQPCAVKAMPNQRSRLCCCASVQLMNLDQIEVFCGLCSILSGYGMLVSCCHFHFNFVDTNFQFQRGADADDCKP